MKTSVNRVAAHRSLVDRSRRARRQLGAMAVEFAMVFPLFFVVVYAIVTFSLMMVAQQNLTLAASEGARAALNWQTNTSVQSALTNRGAAACKAAAAVTASLVSTATCTPTSTACGTNNAMWCVRVLLSYNYLAHPILPAIPFISMAMPKSLNSAATVQINPENLQ